MTKTALLTLAAALAFGGAAPAGPLDERSAAHDFRLERALIELLRAMAERGDATAQFNLGTMYQEGDGVAQDEAEAARWMRTAAEQGHAGAREWLAERGLQ